MATNEITEYYRSTNNSDVRADLVYAVSLIGDERIAIDCGCGAGSDIAFLRDNGFTVHAFDIEAESILLCKERFQGDHNVLLCQDSFTSFAYPSASLMVADASLFFCPPAEFDSVWANIGKSLSPKKGIFCGSFLGPNDTMAGASYDKSAFWPEVMVFTEAELRQQFTGYNIHKWTEHKVSGETPQGIPHHWHIFSIVATKVS